MVKTRASFLDNSLSATLKTCGRSSSRAELSCRLRHAQVIGNHPKCVLALLQAGADPLLLVEGGLRLAPLFIAASSNDPGMLKAMFKVRPAHRRSRESLGKLGLEGSEGNQPF